MRKIRSSIERIDVPAILGSSLDAPAFFAQQRMIRISLPQPFDDQSFANAIRFRDQIVLGLEIESDSAIDKCSDQLPSFVRDLDRRFKVRGHRSYTSSCSSLRLCVFARDIPTRYFGTSYRYLMSCLNRNRF